MYNGGGAGGKNLPHAAPRIGGGGGNSILSVDTKNPLADSIVEEKPGLGPGIGSGEGVGAGGGVGAERGKGIGTRPDGKDALATLRSKPGVGIGAGEGSKIGTRAPGGGKGTGAELPGTGGTGIGYGRGKGLGMGNGSGVGVGDGDGGRTGNGLRGIPFGDVAGLLKGDPNGGGGAGGGPGGNGRGAVFGSRPTVSGGGPMHIVYCMDVSGSMRECDKVGQAKAALKKALAELRPTDSFNIIFFYRQTEMMFPALVSATPRNVLQASAYVELEGLHPGTNISGAIGEALEQQGVTHVFLMTDGEPNGGISDFGALRAYVKARNTENVQILTLALGIGEQFPGMELLKGLAADNRGTYAYINLSGHPDSPQREIR